MKIKNILLAILSVTMIMPAANVFASGLEVAETPITLNVGETETISIIGDDCAGRVDITSSNMSVATVSESAVFVDDDTKTIEITGEAAGTATITFFAAKLATYSTEETISNTTKTINVTVIDPNQPSGPEPSPESPQSTASIKASIAESLTITLSEDSLVLNLTDKELNVESIEITGRTNAYNGYTISTNINNDYTELKHTDELVGNSIPSITENKNEGNFPDTAWGYSLETENFTFKPVPLTPTNIFTTFGNGENTHSFTVGAKAKEAVAGEYENEFIFTIIANPILEFSGFSCNPNATTIFEAVCMQDVKDSVKDSMVLERQYQLVDSRDNKKYFVAKLADGDVWMTQNLDYDLSVTANQTLVPETSNVTETRNVVPNMSGWKITPDDPELSFGISINYLEGGDYYIAGGLNKTAGFSELPENDVNRHYHIGDFYSWNAATAGQGCTGNDPDVPDRSGRDVNESICPAGWRLPTTNYNYEDHSYRKLILAYETSGGQSLEEKFRSAPLFFARAGGIYYYEGFIESPVIDDIGVWGSYWSSMEYRYGTLAVMALRLDDSRVNGSELQNHSVGHNIRCVAL